MLMADSEPPDRTPPEPVTSTDRAANPLTSRSLLYRARDHDQSAWDRIFYLYRPLVLYWCGRRGVRDADAEDVLQEVFRGVAAGLASFRHDRPGDTFRGWLYGITHNQLLMHFRRRQHQPQAVGGSDALARLAELSDPAQSTNDDPPEELSVSTAGPSNWCVASSRTVPGRCSGKRSSTIGRVPLSPPISASLQVPFARSGHESCIASAKRSATCCKGRTRPAKAGPTRA